MARSLTRVRNVALATLVTVALAPPAGAVKPLLQGPNGVPSLAPLLEQVTPAVVNIAVRSTSAGRMNPLLRDPFFRRFFDLPETPRERERLSAGSGVIVDAEEGYVITNHHVIENGEEIVVTLKDRRQLDAELVGSDPETDIAVLKVDAENLTEMPFGDSDALRVGDFVVAVGNPFGLGQTVTSGIVSALGRTGLNVEGYEDFIQTDAPINPGNSGGALVTLTGELVGINTAILSPAGGNIGIGFSVPSAMARSVMEQLIEYGEVRRGRLGIVIQNLTPDLAETLDVKVTAGAVVREVQQGSGAAEAGVEAGDIIIAIDGEPVQSSSDLRNKIGLTPVGETVELELIRDGERRTIRATVGESETASASAGDVAPQLEGATFRDLDAGSGPTGGEGVLVADVEGGSPAAENGLREGDVILAVNRTPVDTVEELQTELEEAETVIALNVVRDDSQLFIVIQ